MRGAVYNSAIPNAILKSVNCVSRPASLFAVVHLIFRCCSVLAMAARAADWSATEQQLARKIVAVTGPGAVALTVENRSSLGRRDSEIVQNGLRSALEQVGHPIREGRAGCCQVTISLSENPTSYVWVAEIRQGKARPRW